MKQLKLTLPKSFYRTGVSEIVPKLLQLGHNWDKYVTVYDWFSVCFGSTRQAKCTEN